MKIYINIDNARWNKYSIDFNRPATVAANLVHAHKDAEVSITLTDDKSIHKLNREYRGKDSPTNVLSFEMGDDILLGDIFISLETVEREAAAAGITVADHAAHMVVHGVLHLNGYDHINDADANVMEALEVKALRKIGIKNPYADEVKCTCPGDGVISWLRRMFRGQPVRENSWRQYFALAVCGLFASFAFAPGKWWLMFAGLGCAYWLLSRDGVRVGGFLLRFLRAAPFGAAYGLGMFWWVLHSIYVVPELTAQFAIWTAPGVIGLMIAGVIIFATPFAVSLKSGRNNAYSAILFAATWTFVLWLREWFLTGFPWNPIANITLSYPIVANSMSLWGALGLTFIIVLIITSVVEILRDVRDKKVWVLFALCASVLGVGTFFGYKNIIASNNIPSGAQKIIRIVQPARSQSQKMAYNRADAIANANANIEYIIKLAQGDVKPDLIVFPETSYPYAIVPGDTLDMARELNSEIVIGATTYDGMQLYNSMIVANENGDIENVYHKSHLVPFGEYKPLGFLPAPSNLGAGQGPSILNAGGINFAPAICYEIIFSDSLVPYSENPEMIINITNDTWFGTTPGVYQHLDMVRRYAIESGLPIVRANYSGISAFISASGEIVSALPVGVSGHLDGFVWGAHMTPYRFIGRNGMMIIILAVAIGLQIIFKNRK